MKIAQFSSTSNVGKRYEYAPNAHAYPLFTSSAFVLECRRNILPIGVASQFNAARCSAGSDEAKTPCGKDDRRESGTYIDRTKTGRLEPNLRIAFSGNLNLPIGLPERIEPQ